MGKIIEWTEDDTKSVKEYMERFDKGEVRALPVPRPSELGPGGFEKWLEKADTSFRIIFKDKDEEHRGVGTLLENRFTVNYIVGGYYVVSQVELDVFDKACIKYTIKEKIQPNSQAPEIAQEARKIATLANAARDAGTFDQRTVTLKILNDRGYVGWKPEERVWSEKDTELIENTIRNSTGSRPTSLKEFEQLHETLATKGEKMLMQNERITQLINLVAENANPKDIEELHRIEQPYFDLFKIMLGKGEIEKIPVRPSEDLCELLYGKGNYEFKWGWLGLAH